MNLVLEPLKEQKFASAVFESRNEKTLYWLFVFNFNQNVSESFLYYFLNNYFISFQNINFESNIYVLAYSEMAILYEVYKKTPEMNLNVVLLCNYNQTTDTGQRTKFDQTNFALRN